VTQSIDSVEELKVEPRTPRADHRVDLYLILLATAAACAMFVVAVLSRVLPPNGIAIAFFAVAPLAGALALVVVAARSTGGREPALRWFSSGLLVAVAAMVLQLVAFPTVSATGGPLGTDGQSSAALYVLFHLAPALAAVAGALAWATRWRRPLTVVGLLLGAGLALDLVPLPSLLTPDGRFTPLLVVLELALAVFMVVAGTLWVLNTGRSASPLPAWVAVALSLSFYDVLFNAIGGARFTPVWWASLSLRDATYVVLAVGCIVAVLTALRQSEAYSESELGRREQQLGDSLAVTRRLLIATADLSRATTLEDVVTVVRTNARAATGGHDAVVALAGTDEPLSASGPDAAALVRLVSGDMTVSASRDAVFLHGQDRISAHFTGLVRPPTGVRSLAVVPIVAGEWLCGHLLVWSMDGARWHPLDMHLLGGIADQAGLAIVRAQAFEDEARAARTLQRSLLPAALPEVPGVRLGAMYRPGVLGSSVGGDWYDCIAFRDGRVALVIGDVMGKGLRAAAVMGQVRTAVRSVAAANPAPLAVLTALDEVALDLDADEIVTLTYVLLDLPAGRAQVARAGHLPPVVVDAEGRAEVMYDGGSTPLGTPDPDRVEATVPLGPGSTLVLFTDGVVEKREHAITEGIDLLVDTVNAAGRGLHEDPQGTIERLVAHADGEDDMALLVAALH
jgi:hypothetical protein